MAQRTRVGVVGCGLIAQVMHLPYLAELDDRFEIAALCDLSERVVGECARRYGVERTTSRWEELVEAPLDAVMVLTPGSHAPVATAAARAGRHVFVEKPMCLSVAEGVEMIAAASEAGVRLMVGTMKRYDPAYERLVELVGELDDVRLVRVTTLESPLEPYVAHLPLVKASDVSEAVTAELAADDEARLDAALDGVDEVTRRCYRWILLDNLVHEVNMLRGALGEPTRLEFSQLDPRCVSFNLAFGQTRCELSWVDLPGIAAYHQELAFYAPGRRVTLALPSPFLRSMPSRLVVEEGAPGTPHARRSSEVVSYDEAFKRELVEFEDCVRTGREPRTPGADGLRDVALCTAIARAAVDREPVDDPSRVDALAAGEMR